MIIAFTADIIRASSGFVARASELRIVSPPARTQRTALRQLKDKLRHHLQTAAKRGKLGTLLKDAGYIGMEESPAERNRFEPSYWDTKNIELLVPLGKISRRPSNLKRSRGK